MGNEWPEYEELSLGKLGKWTAEEVRGQYFLVGYKNSFRFQLVASSTSYYYYY
jgi:hypothetical protein